MPTRTHTVPPCENNSHTLRLQLRQRLLALSYRAFLQCVIHALSAEGYGTVRPAGRRHWKGRNQGGGWDAEAEWQVGQFGTVRCLIAVKQFDALPVQQRFIDELRGTCLRAGAHRAVLVTLSTFPPVSQVAAGADTRLVPVRLIDGEALMDLLTRFNIGVRRGKTVALSLDEEYFEALERRFPAVGQGQSRRRTKSSAEQPTPLPTVPAVMITLTFDGGAIDAIQSERL